MPAGGGLLGWTLALLSVMGIALGVQAAALTSFRAPTLWRSLHEWNSFCLGPARSIPDGQGGTFLHFQLLDMLGGQLTGAPIKIRDADGLIDPTWQPGTACFGAEALAVQPDGKVVVANSTNTASVVVRLLPDGAPDLSFTPIAFSQAVRHLKVQPDGKILVAIWGPSHGTPPPGVLEIVDPTIVRLEANGALDPNFLRPQLTPALGSALHAPLELDDATNIYVGGRFQAVNGVSRVNFARLLPDGTVDAAYAASSSVPGELGGEAIRGIGLQQDGKAVVVGDLRIPKSAPSSDRIVALRFDEHGVFDQTFVLNRRVDLGMADYPRMLVMLPDDRVVLAGKGLSRLNADGSRDPTFVQSQLDFISWVSRLSDGRLLAPGVTTNGLVVFRPDGELESQFITGGFGRSTAPSAQVLLPNGQLILGGNFNRAAASSLSGLARLSADTGELLPAQLNLHDRYPESVLTDTSGGPPRIAPAGSDAFYYLVTLEETNWRPFLVLDRQPPELDSQGTRFVAHDSRTDPLLHGVTDLVSLPDGRLWLIGNSPDAAAAERMVQRFLASGGPDPTFALDPVLQSQLAAVVFGPDYIEELSQGTIRFLCRMRSGAMLFAVTTIQGETYVVRLDEDGRVDTGFNAPRLSGVLAWEDYAEVLNPLTGVLDFVEWGTQVFASDRFQAAAELADGRLVIGGSFRQLGTNLVHGLAVLNPDGSLDPSFVSPRLRCTSWTFAEPSVLAVTTDEAGWICVAGFFDEIDGMAASGLARLNAAGEVDGSFQSPLAFEPYPTPSAALEVRGTDLYVCGTFRALGEVFPRAAWRIDLTLRPHLEFAVTPAAGIRLRARGNGGESLDGSQIGRLVLQVADRLGSQWESQSLSPELEEGWAVYQLPWEAGAASRFYRVLLK